LPDEDREREQLEKRAALIAEYTAEQEKVKAQKLNITYSYWDGSGHRRSTTVTQGSTMGLFLAKVKKEIEGDFPELKATAVEHLMYIKEDLIIPHHTSFYELIKNQVRGKSGPLFDFTATEDVRIGGGDVRQESRESHAGKIVDKKWYERNKHIFPASRWEMYDASKTFDKYTVKGHEVTGNRAQHDT